MDATGRIDKREQHEQEQQRRQLHWATLGIMVIATCITILDIASRINANSPIIAPITVLIFMGAVAGLIANRLIPRGQIWLGILVINGWSAILILYIAQRVGEIFIVLIILLALSFALPYVNNKQLRILTIGALLVGVLGIALAQDWDAGSPLIRVVQRSLLLGLILWLLWIFHQRLNVSLIALRQANHELGSIRTGLEDQVAQRTADLQQALAEVELRAADQHRMIEEITRQEQVIRELSVPVLPVSTNILVMPLVGNLDADRLAMVLSEALQAVERRGPRFLILDITGVPVIDSQVAQGLVATVQAVRMLGTTSLLVGIRPEVAQTIVGLNLPFEGLLPFSDLQAALAFAKQ